MTVRSKCATDDPAFSAVLGVDCRMSEAVALSWVGAAVVPVCFAGVLAAVRAAGADDMLKAFVAGGSAGAAVLRAGI